MIFSNEIGRFTWGVTLMQLLKLEIIEIKLNLMTAHVISQTKMNFSPYSLNFRNTPSEENVTFSGHICVSKLIHDEHFYLEHCQRNFSFFHCVMWTRYEQFFGFLDAMCTIVCFNAHAGHIIYCSFNFDYFFYSYVRWHLDLFQMILNFYCGMPVSSDVRCRQRFMIQFDLGKLFVEIFFGLILLVSLNCVRESIDKTLW